MVITLNTRSGQSQPLSITEVDENWDSIIAAFAAIPAQSVGSVTSVAITVPSFLNRTGSPITSSGTIEITLATQAANKIFSGPTNGSDAAPTFRTLVEADLPTISLSKLATTTASRVATFNGSGVLAASSTITTTELEYLDGVTSSIQSQLNAKQATITVLAIANGGTNASTAQGARVNLLPSLTGNAGEFLRVNVGETDVEWAVPTSAIPTINSIAGALTINSGVGTTGNDVNISTLGTTITVNVPPASATVSGKMTILDQSIKGVKTFIDGVVLPVTDTHLAYSNSGVIQGSANYVVNDTLEQMELKRISVAERQIALGYNATYHTTNYNIDAETDFIVYMDATSGNLDASLPDTANPASQLGTIFRIVKTTTTNNLVIKAQGSDSIGALGVTTYTLTGVKAWVELQMVKSGLYSILSTGTIS